MTHSNKLKFVVSNFIDNLKFWFRYWTDADFRYQVKYEEWSALHTCVDCGGQDWAGHKLVFDPMGSGMLCQSCLREQDEQDMQEEYEDEDFIEQGRDLRGGTA